MVKASQSPTDQPGRNKSGSSPGDVGGLQTKINLYSLITRPGEQNYITLAEFIRIVKGNQHKDACLKCRAETNKKQRDYYKSFLPAVTFAGTFSHRANDKLIESTGLACIDFDVYDGTGEEIKEVLKKDPYVLLSFLSPSGGVKAVVQIPKVKNDYEYKVIYDNLLQHYENLNPNTDISTKDIARLCFVSYDPGIYMNKEVKVFDKKIDIAKSYDVTTNHRGETQVKEGERNQTLFKKACGLRHKLSKEECLAACLEVNKAYSPPLDTSEVKKIVSSAYSKEYIRKDNQLDTRGFILDSKQVLESKTFVFDAYKGNVLAYGMLLPRWEDTKDNKGKIIGTTQRSKGALITSRRELITVGHHTDMGYKVRFDDVPYKMQLRWELESIREYLNGGTAKEFNEIFSKIEEQYEKYIDMPKEWRVIHTLWDMATYFFMLFKVYPIFELRGVSGTGKTKAMSISSLITFNSTGIMVNPSEATLFRETHDRRPTKYIDEAENLFREDRGELIPDTRAEVINSSYRYDGTVSRVEKIGNRFQTLYYNTYSPTMVASINGLQGATESRAIIRIATKPKETSGNKGNIEPEPDDMVWQQIRNELYFLGLERWQEVLETYNTLRCDGLSNREFWLWKPLLTIARLVSEQLYTEVMVTAKRQQHIKNMDALPETTWDYKILKAAFELIEEHGRAYMNDIYKKLPQGDYTPREKTISSKLDRLGFRDFRDKDRQGSYIEISKDDFRNKIKGLCPSLFSSYSSHTSHNNNSLSSINNNNNKINSVTNKVKNMMNRDEKSESRVTNTTNTTNVTQGKVRGGIRKPSLLEIMKELDQGHGAHYDSIVESMQDAKHSEKDFMEYWNYARQAGDIHEVRPGYWKVLA